jgi:hypothetical protein
MFLPASLFASASNTQGCTRRICCPCGYQGRVLLREKTCPRCGKPHTAQDLPEHEITWLLFSFGICLPPIGVLTWMTYFAG